MNTNSHTADALREILATCADPLNRACEEYAKLERELAETKADAAAVRELMNVYNLGGWTDAVGPMKRALKAEADLETLGDELERIRAKLVLAADDEIMRQESARCVARPSEETVKLAKSVMRHVGDISHLTSGMAAECLAREILRLDERNGE